MEEFLRSWSYLGIFLGIIATGAGFPMPEELPVVVGGALAGSGNAIWWVMLPVCIVGVVLGDSLLYVIGRFWGRRLLRYRWVQHWLPPARVEKFDRAFHQNGIRILLLARLTPGIRMPIFFTAGLTRLPLPRFMLADGIYAIPIVTLLFSLGFWFTEGMVKVIEQDIALLKPFLFFAVVIAVGGYAIYYLRKRVVSSEVKDTPPAPAAPEPFDFPP